MALAIASAVIAAFMSFYLSQQRSMQHGRTQIDTSQSVRTALDQITRDLRLASRNPLAATSCGFLVADAAEVDFTFDVNNDGVCDSTSATERRGFRRQGTTIQTRVAVGTLADWETLAENVTTTSAIFSYRKIDGSGNLVAVTSLPASSADRAAIARVDVTLRFSQSSTIGPAVGAETSSVMMRNRTL